MTTQIADLQAENEKLKKDSLMLNFLLKNRRFIDQHIITGSYVCLIATSGVVATKGSQFAKTAREAIAKAMEQDSDER